MKNDEFSEDWVPLIVDMQDNPHKEYKFNVCSMKEQTRFKDRFGEALALVDKSVFPNAFGRAFISEFRNEGYIKIGAKPLDRFTNVIKEALK